MIVLCSIIRVAFGQVNAYLPSDFIINTYFEEPDWYQQSCSFSASVPPFTAQNFALSWWVYPQSTNSNLFSYADQGLVTTRVNVDSTSSIVQTGNILDYNFSDTFQGQWNWIIILYSTNLQTIKVYNGGIFQVDLDTTFVAPDYDYSAPLTITILDKIGGQVNFVGQFTQISLYLAFTNIDSVSVPTFSSNLFYVWTPWACVLQKNSNGLPEGTWAIQPLNWQGSTAGVSVCLYIMEHSNSNYDIIVLQDDSANDVIKIRYQQQITISFWNQTNANQIVFDIAFQQWTCITAVCDQQNYEVAVDGSTISQCNSGNCYTQVYAIASITIQTVSTTIFPKMAISEALIIKNWDISYVQLILKDADCDITPDNVSCTCAVINHSRTYFGCRLLYCGENETLNGNCSSCSQGYFKQPPTDNWCWNTCPVGYTQSGSSCILDYTYIKFEFEDNRDLHYSNRDGIILTKQDVDQSLAVQSEINDYLGQYFDSATIFDAKMEQTGEPIVLQQNWTIALWVRCFSQIPSYLFTILEEPDLYVLFLIWQSGSSISTYFMYYDNFQLLPVQIMDSDTQSQTIVSKFYLDEWFSLIITSRPGQIDQKLNQKYLSMSPQQFYTPKMALAIGGYPGQAFHGIIYSLYILNTWDYSGIEPEWQGIGAASCALFVYQVDRCFYIHDAGEYLYPNQISLPYCPFTSFSTPSNAVCNNISNQVTAYFHFDQMITGVYQDGNYTIELGSNPDIFYPEYDDADPIVALQRGLYFDGTKKAQLFETTYGKSQPYLGPIFQIGAYIYPENFGSIIYFGDNTTAYLQIFPQFNPQLLTVNWGQWPYNIQTTTYSTALSYGNFQSEWYLFIVTFTDVQSVKIQINDQVQEIAYNTYFDFVLGSQFYIGSNPIGQIFYQGYIFNLLISNQVLTTIENDLNLSAGCGVGQYTCIPNHLINYANILEQCRSDCQSCKDTVNCNLCKLRGCFICESYQSNYCQQCFPNWLKNTSDKCICNGGIILADEACIICHIPNCLKCEGNGAISYCVECEDNYFLYEGGCYQCKDFQGFGKQYSILLVSDTQLEYLNDQICQEICGDGLNLGLDQCDDGNQEDGDGCSSLCKIENGFFCYGGGLNTADRCISIGNSIIEFKGKVDDKYLFALELPQNFRPRSQLSVYVNIRANLALEKAFMLLNNQLQITALVNQPQGQTIDFTTTLNNPNYELPFNEIYSEFYFQVATNCIDFDLNGNCLKCEPNYSLFENRCQCSIGYYLDGKFICRQCPKTCHSCELTNNQVKCTSCFSHMILLDNCYDCGQIQGFGLNYEVNLVQFNDQQLQNLSIACIEYCGDGINLGYHSCDDGNNLGGDGCSEECEVEDGWFCDLQICTRKVQFGIDYVQQQEDFYEIQVNFTNPLPLSHLNPHNFLLVEMENEKMYNWVSSYQTNEQLLVDGINIKIFIDQNVMIHKNISIEFFNNEFVLQTNMKKQIQVENGYQDQETEDTQQLISDIAKFAVVSAFISAFISSLIGIKVNPQGIFSIFEMMQFYNFLLYINIDYPENLRGFLQQMDFANLEFAPNVFLYLIEADDGRIYENGKFQYEQMPANFTLNAGKQITIGMVLLTLCCLVLAINKYKEIGITQKLFKLFKFGIFIRFSIEVYLELSLALVIKIYNLEFTSLSLIVDFIVFFVSFILFLTVKIIFISKVMLQKQDKLSNDDYKGKYGEFYEQFKFNRYFSRNFYLIQQARRLGIVLILIYLQNFKYQINWLIVLQLIYTLSFSIVLPYKEDSNLVEIIQESGLLSVLICIKAFMIDNLSSLEAYNLAWVIISIAVASLVPSFSVTAFLLMRAIYRRCRRRKVKPEFSIIVSNCNEMEPFKSDNSNIEVSGNHLQTIRKLELVLI